jgi:hypothetical protein
MKFLLIAALFLANGFISQAQTVVSTTLLSANLNAIDTVDNTETVYLSLPSTRSVASYFKGGTVVFKALEISGTGGGTATLEVSSNGTDFAAIPTLSPYTIVDQTAAQTVSWRVTDFAAKSLRIKITGSGTMSYKVYGSAFLAN